MLSLRAVTFVIGFVTVNQSFIPHDDAIQEVLSFTVIKLQVNGEKSCESAYVYTRSSFFSALVTQATRIIAALPPITLVVSLKIQPKMTLLRKRHIPFSVSEACKNFFFSCVQGKKSRFHFIGMAEQ
jgi:hypothetical protein